MFDFTIITTDVPQAGARPGTAARTGIFETPHGTLLTPVFAPVGTQATVKTLTPRDLDELGATLVLANTYHLYLRPGTRLVASLAGCTASWAGRGPMLTDSGGFQVFSLAQMRKVDPDGVTFRSHIDGSLHRFTPESAIASAGGPRRRHHHVPGRVPGAAGPEVQRGSAGAHARLGRALPGSAQRRPDQALFGIVQGGIFPDLRVRERPHAARPGLPRLCHRRAERGRDQRADVRHARRDRAGAARRTSRAT